MRWRFTLTHDVEGSIEISEPDGWKGAKIKLERDNDFFSLIEYYEGAASGGFIFYGDNGVENGGISFIKNIEENYGFDATIEFLAEFSDDDVTYQQIFSGLLDLSAKNEMKDNKMQVPVIRDDFWSKFINRLDTPANLSSDVDMDGNSVSSASPTTITLTGQTVRYNFKRTIGYNAANAGLFTYGEDSGSSTYYLLFDNSRNDLDEIDNRYEYGTQVSSVNPSTISKYLFQTEYAGEYEFDITIRYALIFGAPVDVSVQWYLTHNIGGVFTGIAIDTPSAGTAVTSHSTGFGSKNLNTTITLTEGAEIYIYGIVTLSASTSITYFPDYDADTGAGFSDVYTDLEVTSDTIYPDTTVEGFMVYDLLTHVLRRMGLGSSPLFSNYFNTGCGSKLFCLKGLQIRGYPLAEKPFFISFKQIWNGLNPILNLGLTYQYIADIKNGDFLNTLYPSFNSSTSVGNSWVWDNDHARVILPSTFAATRRLLLPIEIRSGETYQLTLNFDILDGGSGAGSSTRIIVYLTDDVDFSDFSDNINYPLGSGQSLTANITASQDWAYIAVIVLAQTSSSFGRIFDLDSIVKIAPSADVKKIRIEEKEHLLEDTVSVNFSNVREISSTYDQELIFKTIKVGYKKWESEDISGIDDPQTKHVYSTRFKKVGKELTIESDFIAAGLAIETTRRTTREKSADYKYDNDTFIISLNTGGTAPELDENFDGLSDIINSDTRYNLVLTPKRSLLRWSKYILGCLQSYLTSVLKFVSGEGNYHMGSSYDCSIGDECMAIICDFIYEKSDLDLATYAGDLGYYFLPIVYDIKIPMGWDEYQTIMDNPKKAIGISQSDTGHIVFKIKLLEYDIVKGQATIKAWPKTFLSIGVIDSGQPEQICY